jgi:hypothetical protein
MIDQKRLEAINKEVYRRFPEIKGKRPRVQLQRSPDPGKSPAYLLVYQGRLAVSTNKSLPFSVRVVVDERGKILKLSSSR